MKKKGGQFPLFHGTGAWLNKGDTVNPTDSLYTVEPRAYATTNRDAADRFAASNAAGRHRTSQPQMSLFAPVYGVSPKGGDTRSKAAGINTSVSDARGFTVEGTAGYASHEGNRL